MNSGSLNGCTDFVTPVSRIGCTEFVQTSRQIGVSKLPGRLKNLCTRVHIFCIVYLFRVVAGFRVFLTFHTEKKKINIYKRYWKTAQTRNTRNKILLNTRKFCPVDWTFVRGCIVVKGLRVFLTFHTEKRKK